MGRRNIISASTGPLAWAAVCVCGLAVGQGPPLEVPQRPAPEHSELEHQPAQYAGEYSDCPEGHPWAPAGLSQLELRTSASHGRAMGPGQPLRGTSWLNRPYDVSLDYGVFLMTSRVSPNVRPGNDYFGALGIGWDFDYYWGTQFRIGWTTPDLLNTTQPDRTGANDLLLSDWSLLYYPWGDSRLRPYYRIGLGLTDLQYTNDAGLPVDPFLFTMPIGVGIKYQTERWLALRAELIDNIAVGQNETGTLNNLTITFGAEWRFGGKPTGYSAWRRGGTIW
ncbi:hypothetical protein Pla175_21650 [Pirellulimonas nuda]|uniref:Outer membrane protein beta-barrel domain-containing protein n=1 Tax=Pirellulimonas nuda TaxID=2528009 RepID=A0A518DBD5_9BACT|nr:outer membrane beta-barrel protein [Pirellulimonas nuda]QDU88782.1 hypothetical protein Pla175_21650 [Pirellulimonas nuda]